ncbi:MAG: DNA alkylation repair protein [Phaeodactylibacter sp.]|nr:DNA alkylation repair protein [Phaeodactylibacter sp.]MCB9276328.1 DNA alkylation repair protein [Lewinellaceae bacterium]
MSTLLKDVYSPEFYAHFVEVMQEVIPGFDGQRFTRLVFDEAWAGLELKDRMRHTSRVLHHFLPRPFPEAVPAMLKAIALLREKKMKNFGFACMFFPDYIENFGLEHYDSAVAAMEQVTHFASCEFAVRPFILKYGDKMLGQMRAWSEHEDQHVRRLSSEGCRPRLPWAMALPPLKQDPTPILPILENLKDDPSEYVRRSVANNLNDISKDNPGIALSIFRSWIGQSPETDWVVKHACRTLLKQGRTEAMELFGYSELEHISAKNFRILSPEVRIGEALAFAFDLENSGSAPATVRLEYGLYYRKANGQLSRKVFKISEKGYAPHSASTIERRQSFRPITTRTFYPGGHELSLIINGKEVAKQGFMLLP